MGEGWGCVRVCVFISFNTRPSHSNLLYLVLRFSKTTQIRLKAGLVNKVCKLPDCEERRKSASSAVISDCAERKRTDMTLIVKIGSSLFTSRHESKDKHELCPVYLPQAFILKQLYCFLNSNMNNVVDV